MDLKVKRVHTDAILPTRNSDDLGWDFYSIGCYHLHPKKPVLINTGICMELPPNVGMILKDRSSLGIKGIHVLAGVIDSSYRGEILVCLTNLGTDHYLVRKGDKIVQGILIPYLNYNLVEVDKLTQTSRGEKGFGSTGI